MACDEMPATAPDGVGRDLVAFGQLGNHVMTGSDERLHLRHVLVVSVMRRSHFEQSADTRRLAADQNTNRSAAICWRQYRQGTVASVGFPDVVTGSPLRVVSSVGARVMHLAAFSRDCGAAREHKVRMKPGALCPYCRTDPPHQHRPPPRR
jgi:hypothetical protein